MRPAYFAARGEVPPPPPYSPLAHNCSGKHSGMLAHCVACGWRKDDYLAPDHPLQRAIRAAVAEFTAVPDAELVAGVDGCSAPNYAVPLFRLAQAFARLASATVRTRPTAGRRACSPTRCWRIPRWCRANAAATWRSPRAGRGDWICKIGAEGVQAIGIRSRGLGRWR